MPHQLTDLELLNRYAADKNKAWLGMALERYSVILLGVGMKYLRDEEEAKDMVQQVFIKALQTLEVQTIDNLGGWLYRVAKNESLNVLRKNKLYPTSDVNEHHIAGEIFDIEQHIQQDITVKKLQEAMKELKEEQRWCIDLFYFQQKSYQEITEITKFDIKQVKSNIQNGKRNLKLKLD